MSTTIVYDCILPNIASKCIFVDSEGQGWTPREPCDLEVRPYGGFSEHAHVRHVQDSGDVDKVFDHVLRPDLDVGSGERLHHFAEVTA